MLEELVNIDSGSYCKAGIDLVGKRMGEEYARLGFSVEDIIHADCGNGLVVRRPGSGKHVLLIGHLDTVFPEGSAARQPYFTENGRAFGPGVLDMKGCLVGGLYAVRALCELEKEPAADITVVMSGDEEIGSFHMRDIYEREARHSDWAIVMEPARENGEIVTARKGGAYLTVTAHGKAAHAGIQPETGRNAVEELALKIGRLRSLNDFEAGTTITIGKFSGGTVRNVVAEDAQMEVDLRFRDMEKGEELFKKIREILAAPEIRGIKLTYTLTLSRPPLVSVKGSEALAAIVKEVSRELEIPYQAVETGGLSDGNLVCGFGVPTIDGMGPVGGRMCSPEEYLILDSLPRRAARLAVTIERLGRL